MPAKKLEHFTIWTVALESSVRFYVDLLGLVVGPRPDAPIPGAWLYNNSDTPIVHLVDVANKTSKGMLKGSGRDVASLRGSGAIDHIAFEADDIEDVRSKLSAKRYSFRQAEVPSMSLRQIFVLDPNGVQVELNFHEAPSLDGAYKTP